MTTTWFVYVLVSMSTGRTYVGISVDPDRRLLEHNGDLRGGAKSTRVGRPWKIGRLYGPIESQSEALKLEHRIKKQRGKERLRDLQEG